MDTFDPPPEREGERHLGALPVDVRPRDGARAVWDEASGYHWTVYEFDANAVPGAGGVCLVFERREAVRRLCPAPARWRDLSDAELLALTRRADP